MLEVVDGNGVEAPAGRRSLPTMLGMAMILLLCTATAAHAQAPATVPPGPNTVSPDVLGTPSSRPLPNGPPADALTGPVYEGNSPSEFANLPVGPGVVEGMCPMPSPWRCGVYCGTNQGACSAQTWENSRPIPWQVFAQGEYIGPARMRHVPEYRLRVADRLGLVFRLTTIPSAEPYELSVGDEVTIESLTSDDVQRSVIIQPDGTVTLRLLGQVQLAGRTIEEVRQDLDQRYKKFLRDPSITVTPIKLNSRLQELRATVDARQGIGGQQREARVTPEGTIQLPGLGSVPAQGLTMNELKREIDVRYTQLVSGFEVTPVLIERAPRYIFVVGEVRQPGRFELTGPTTLMQSIAMAGGWNVGGNVNHIVVFRRDECWNLMATQLTVCKALFGHAPCPADEIWLRDSDVVVVPKRAILVVDDAISLIFTRGLYGVVPFNFTLFQGMTNAGLLSPANPSH
ncbi:MAG TPA: polysaccharide biosynthesis/export family protein [Pirellulales bacterium]|nr:polysaccharide biosynthesis/export family protein [Pirellulales bacterium]